MSLAYENPTLPGFYPDPYVLRVDKTFYVINSSFQFFPGLPIHKCKDLINWELVGGLMGNRPQKTDRVRDRHNRVISTRESRNKVVLMPKIGNAINGPS